MKKENDSFEKSFNVVTVFNEGKYFFFHSTLAQIKEEKI